jgi:hypothetical protein
MDRKMPNHSFSARLVVATAALVIVSFVLLQSACFSKKVKTEAMPGAPVRLALLPFNVPSDSKDLRWTALAAPILMAKAGENAEGLDILPLWETMPVALNIAGVSRTFTQDSAATVASWVSAKWSTLGEIGPTKTGISLTVDFIPARSNLVPFRYAKTGKLDLAGAGLHDAYNQFLRYLAAKPFPRTRGNELAMTATKDLAEALDREYGWFVEAEPGKAQDIVTKLLRTDEHLAKSLFSPTLYPALTEKK